jgi:ATP-binding cassette, subfamily B, multidrug efflux pump
MHLIRTYLKPYYGRLFWQMLIKIGGTVIELFLPSMLSIILDEYAPAGDMHSAWMMGIAMLVCAVLAWLGNCTANRLSTGISREVTRKLRRDLFDKIESLSTYQRDKITDSSMVSRLTSDTYNVHQMVDRMQRLGVRAPILLVGGLSVAACLEPVLTLVMAGTLPLLALVVVLASKRSLPLYTQVQQCEDGMVRKIQENMAGARVVRALSRTFWERDRFDEVNESLAESQCRASRVMATVSPLVSLLLNFGLAAVILVGAMRVSVGLSQPGKIIAFMSYFTIILNALLAVSRLFMMYSKGQASANRIKEILMMESDLKIKECAPVKEDAYLVFDHVSFSYNKRYADLSDISFSMKEGETLGIIGPTGAGKSTLLSLLLRQYDPDQGEIRLGGRNIASMTAEELRKNVGIVFQNDFLMADTLRENIRFGRDIDDDALLAATDRAQANFIRQNDEELDFALHVRGRNLSGGQQQRVLISRALAGKPRLLLLDDCSSALDFKTDLALRRSLREEYAGTTTILVAQRVSAVMAADHILVLDKGRMVGYGKHDELRQSCPMYRDLCRLQLGDVPNVQGKETM